MPKLWVSVGLAVAVLLFVSIFFMFHNRADALQGSGRLLTIHDRGEEKLLLSDAKTIGEALEHAGITLDSHDAVEPAVTETMVASEYSINIYRARPVTVIDGSTRQKIVTAYQTAEQITKDVGINLYPEDTTKLSRSSDLLADGAGLQLTIDRATAFNFTVYGTKSIARTQSATVGDMLKEKGITIGENDKVSLPLTTPITADMNIQVWREGHQTITVEEPVVFGTQQINDNDQFVGYKAVQTAGVNGKKNVTYEVEIRDGQEVNRKEIATIVTAQPTGEVVVIGAKYRGAYTTPSQNESIAWNYLINQGFTREQTAGIMGNLQQEHGFNTTGDGLAQWTGSRKAALMARDDPYNIYTQLDYLMYELNGSYASVKNAIKASTTVKDATIIFQNKFERCGICVEDRRIQFAYNILASH